MEDIELLRLRAKAKLKLKQTQAPDPLDLETVGNDELIEQMRPVIKKMESGGRYDIYHPKTRSGKQALGAYGVVPEFWFDRFPELGLKVDTESKKRYIDTPALQDSMFSHVMRQGIKEVGADPVKLRAWYYGGPRAVKNLEKGTGHAKQVAYDDTGKEIQMPSHASDSDKFKQLYNGELPVEEIQNLDTRAMAGLPPLRYTDRDSMDPANRMFNNPEEQARAVQDAQQQAISELPLREQMGSGVGAFAYKFPGMGTLADLGGKIARALPEGVPGTHLPDGSRLPVAAIPGVGGLVESWQGMPQGVNKKEEIAEYNKNRTLGQFAGELTPDVLMASMGGVAAARKLGASAIKNKHVRRVAEGAVAGGVSAAGHQLQHLGSGESLQGKEAALEIGISAALPLVGGVLGDALKRTAPGVLRRTVRPSGTVEEKVFDNALDEGLVPVVGGLKRTQKRTDKYVQNLEDMQSMEALNASQRPAPIGTPPVQPQPTLPPAATPQVRPQPAPVQPPSTLAQPVIPVKPANHPSNPGFIGPKLPPQKVKKPTLTFAKDAETLAREDAERAAADKAKRLADAEARRNPKPAPVVEEPAVEVKTEKLKKEAKELSGAEKRMNSLQELADEGALKDAFDAEKSLSLMKKLKGQLGAITIPGKTPDEDILIESVANSKTAGQAIMNLTRNPNRSPARNRDAMGHIKASLTKQIGREVEPHSENTLIAKDKQGKVLAAIDYHLTESETPSLFIANLGSTGKSPSASKHLVSYVAKIAARMGIKVTGKPTQQAKPFYKGLGADTDFGKGEGKPTLDMFAEKAGQNPVLKASIVDRKAAREARKLERPVEYTPRPVHRYTQQERDILNGIDENQLEEMQHEAIDMGIENYHRAMRSRGQRIPNDSDEEMDQAQVYIDEALEELRASYITERTPSNGQRGAIPNLFKKKPAAQAPAQPMQMSRKVGFQLGPMKRAKDRLATEKADAIKRGSTAQDYDEAERTLETWEAEAKSRPTAQGGPRAQMTVEDLISFTKVIEKEITKADTGKNKALKLLLEEAKAELKTHAPKAAEAGEKLDKVKPFKEALDNRISKNDNKALLMPWSVRLSGLATGSLLGAANAEKGHRLQGAAKGAATGFLLSQLATTPGGAALLHKTGKALGDRTRVKSNTLAQLQRSAAVKSREKKK